MKYSSIPIGVVIACFLVIPFPFLFGQEIAAKLTPLPTPSPKDFLEVKVHSLIVDPSSMQPVVLLVDPSGERVMPIWIGPNEAAAIQGELDGTKAPRPMTHDLLERVIQELSGVVRRVLITREKGNIYYAVIILEKERKLIELDARPSDSIAMALKFKAPIFVSRSLFEVRGVLLAEQISIEESYGMTIQELTPTLAELFSFKEGKGVLVAGVKEGGRADKDGMQSGDILVEIGDKKIEDVPAMRSVLAEIKSPAQIKMFRKGSFMSLTLNPAD